MKLSIFLREHQREILDEWVSFARTLLPAAEGMSDTELFDHAGGMLRIVSHDIDTWQSPDDQQLKSQGKASPQDAPQNVASIHGAERHAQGFSLLQASAEFRALRATVLRLWLPTVKELTADSVNEMVRFNEAIDQALMASITAYSEQTTHARDMFLAILGDDLRAVLGGLNMEGVFLKESTHPVDASQIAARVNKNVELMKIMVGDLIEFTNSQLGGGNPIKPSREDLGDICHAALQTAKAIHPFCSFEWLAQGDLSGTFDRHRLSQLFTTLMVNAAQSGAKYHPIVIHLQGETDDVVVQVINQGPAIDKLALKSMFKALVQLRVGEGAASRLSSSRSLGMFVAQQIATAHGGSVAVTSDDVHGTTFTVRLPRDASKGLVIRPDNV